MTIATEIEKMQENLSSSYDEAQKLSATMPNSKNFDNLAATIATIKGGGSNSEQTYGVDFAKEYLKNLEDGYLEEVDENLQQTLGETDHAGNISGDWQYKPATCKEYLQDVLTSDNDASYIILSQIKDGIPDKTPTYRFNGSDLMAGRTYLLCCVGGGGGSSTWAGGAGAACIGLYTPAQTTKVTSIAGIGGKGAAAYSRNHNGQDGYNSSIEGTGVSIVCKGGQGAIGLREGDEAGNASTHSYAPVVNVTNGTFTVLRESADIRPRQNSWLDNSSSGLGAGGHPAESTKKAGKNGRDGYCNIVDYVHIAFVLEDGIRVSSSVTPALYANIIEPFTTTDTDLKILKGSNVTYTLYKDGIEPILKAFTADTDQTITASIVSETHEVENFGYIGNPTISEDKIASGFGSADGLAMNNALPATFNEASMIFKGQINSSADYSILLCDASIGTERYFGIRKTNHFSIYTGSWTEGTTYVSLNTDYWFRVEYDGTAFKGYVLKDDGYTLETLPTLEHWSLEWQTTTNIFAGRTFNIGYNTNVTSEYWKGVLDLNECSIYVDGVLWWKPYNNVTITNWKIS